MSQARTRGRFVVPAETRTILAMRSFKLFWNTHKWTGICLALILGTTAVTGFMLLLKKRVSWIQPPTLTGAPGGPDDFITLQRLFDIVREQNHPDFRSPGDIDRIDFRPGDRVFKVQSSHHRAEIQVCAVTGEVMGVAWRRSDLLEDIHDGSFWAMWWHDWIMPVVALALLVSIGSGVWLWVEPMLRRRRRQSRPTAPGRS